ncbi:MAG: hypothetical protein IID45_01955, partial [Planctomycetes bacterium]|nr:hypothetical protein [Planctomycetota bacterium]
MRTRRRIVIAMLNAPSAPVLDAPTVSVQDAPSAVPQRQIVQMSGKTKSRKTPETMRSRQANFEPRADPVTDASWKDRLRRSLFTPRTLIVVAMILLGVAVVPQIPGWLPAPSSREEYRLESSRIEINAPPRYVPVDFVDQVIRAAKLPKNLSLLDDDLTERIGRAFASHPWVAEVVLVKKSFPARVEVELKYRKPVAMVEVADGVYPITADSILLPSADFSLADTRLYPLIRGVRTLPEGPEGTYWNDMAVLAAAQMAKVLAPHWKSLDLESIDVP